ncbi:hypothetical protein ES705_32914 [subsurface metagenome]
MPEIEEVLEDIDPQLIEEVLGDSDPQFIDEILKSIAHVLDIKYNYDMIDAITRKLPALILHLQDVEKSDKKEDIIKRIRMLYVLNRQFGRIHPVKYIFHRI